MEPVVTQGFRLILILKANDLWDAGYQANKIYINICNCFYYVTRTRVESSKTFTYGVYYA